MRKRGIILLLCGALLAATANAVSLEETRRAAETGDTQAQLKLGEMYYFGEGVQKDEREGRKWIEKAAGDAQYPDADVLMGVILLCGDSVERSCPPIGLIHLERAAARKDKLSEKYKRILPKVLADTRAEIAAHDMNIRALRKTNYEEEKRLKEIAANVDRERESEEEPSPEREFVSALKNLKGTRKPEENTSYLQSSRDGAAHLVLGDGTTWEVDPLDKIKVDLWLPNSGVTTVRADGGGIYDHVLINKETGEQIRAREGVGTVDR